MGARASFETRSKHTQLELHGDILIIFSFDVDYPLEVDDVYWETGDSETRFKQPPGQPSLLQATVAYIKLTQITSFATRTLFGIRKSQQAAGLTGQWIEKTVSLLDSMLNSWYNAIPDHRA